MVRPAPWFHSRLDHEYTAMSAEKEEYIESAISLEGKFPEFVLDGDARQDVLVRFEKSCPVKVVLASGATDDIGGDLELQFSQSTGKLAALRFPGAAQRWKLERCVGAQLPLPLFRVLC